MIQTWKSFHFLNEFEARSSVEAQEMRRIESMWQMKERAYEREGLGWCVRIVWSLQRGW